MFNLLAIGDPVIDTQVQIDDQSAECRVIPHEHLKLCFEYGGKIPVLNSFQTLGGNAANVSVGATRLGLKTAILSTVGADVNGEEVVKELAKNGVDTSFLAIDKTTDTRYSIVLNYEGERTILSYSKARSYEWPKYNLETDWIYYSGLSEGYESLHEKLLAFVKNHPTVRLAVNPGSYLLKYGPHQLKEAVKAADLLIVNKEEAEAISGTTLEKEKTAAGLLRALLKMGPKEVAMTDGPRGAWAGNDDEIFFMKALPVAVVSKAGAGDGFSAGYLAARFYGHDVPHALAWGSANSAGVIQHHGPQEGLLDQKMIDEVLAHFKTIRPLEI